MKIIDQNIIQLKIKKTPSVPEEKNQDIFKNKAVKARPTKVSTKIVKFGKQFKIGLVK